MQAKVIKRSRLNGRYVEPGEVIEINPALAKDWFGARLARPISLPGKTPKVEIQLKALDAYSPEELGELTRKNLLDLARINKIEVPKKISKDNLIDLFEERQEDEGSEKEAGGEGDQGTTKPKEEGLSNMSMKKLLQLARIDGIKVSRKTGRKQLIDLLMEAKTDEGVGEESNEEPEREPEGPGEPEGKNPEASD